MNCECGVLLEKECQRMQNELIVKSAENYEIAKLNMLRADVYCMQHPSRYLISDKSFAAHLMGLCIAMEYDNELSLYKVIQKWEYGKGQVRKPPIPIHLGDLTIFHVIHATSSGEYTQLLHEWALCVWEAYEEHHELAHEWLKEAKRVYPK